MGIAMWVSFKKHELGTILERYCSFIANVNRPYRISNLLWVSKETMYFSDFGPLFVTGLPFS